MRKTLTLLCLVALLGVTLPAQAQLRDQVRPQQAPTKLYDDGAASFLLNTIFSPEHFQMHHSYEMSMGSMGGDSYSMGMYTNTMAWTFNEKLAARMDVSVAFSPFNNDVMGMAENNGARVFLRNAEVMYKPADNVFLHFQVRQSPYGRYMNPYGYYNPYRAAPAGLRSHDLFWND